MSKHIIYGSPASYFTGKARAYLDWKGVDYEEHNVNGEIMKTVILPTVGWPVIPVMETADGRIVQDTVDIITEFETSMPKPSVYPTGGVQRFVSQLLQVLGDDWLLIPAMHYRWHYNEEWIYGEFGKSAAPGATPEQQYDIGKSRGQMFKAMVPMLGVTPETIPGIEKAYEQFLASFSAHLEQHPYVLGARPSFGDFSLFGPLYAHLYRDPKSGHIMKDLAPRVADWVERMQAGAPAASGDLLSDDGIPETLMPILKSHLAEHLPVLKDTIKMFEVWQEAAEDGAELPRSFGMCEFTTGGHTGQMAARSFTLFRLQAALDELALLDDDERARATDLLEKIGGSALIDFTLAHRLERRDYRLRLAL